MASKNPVILNIFRVLEGTVTFILLQVFYNQAILCSNSSVCYIGLSKSAICLKKLQIS
jgi:hypothetical protein